MPRQIFHFVLDGDHYRPVEYVPQPEPDCGAPAVHTDEIPAMEHPVTGEIMTSKSRFRQATRAAGCYELGTDKVTPRGITVDEKAIARDVCDAYERAESRYR